VGVTAAGVNSITDTASTAVNKTVGGVTGAAGKGLDTLPRGVGQPAKHVTQNAGKTVTAAVDNVYSTAGSATKGVQGTVSKTTGAMGRGDARGAVAGATSGVGTLALEYRLCPFFFSSCSPRLP